jgi:predicted DNA binding CopG/RHH family protein
MTKTEPMIRCNHFLPKQLVEQIKQHAATKGTPVAEHVRRALQEYLERQ